MFLLRSSVVSYSTKSLEGVYKRWRRSSPGKAKVLIGIFWFVLTEVYLDWYDFALIIFFTLFLILLMFSFLRSNLRRHIIFIVSMNKFDLIFRSRGDSVASDGLKLTSISHGFMSESSKISNPRSSKQIFLCGIRFNPAVIWQSTLIKLFRMTS
jgi:hypothetical protein